MIAELLFPECDLRFLRNESLLFPIWAFTSHVALLVASETSAFSFETLLVFLCEGVSDLCEDRLIYIHRDCSIIGVLPRFAISLVQVSRGHPLVVTFGSEGVVIGFLLLFLACCCCPLIHCSKDQIVSEDFIEQCWFESIGELMNCESSVFDKTI